MQIVPVTMTAQQWLLVAFWPILDIFRTDFFLKSLLTAQGLSYIKSSCAQKDTKLEGLTDVRWFIIDEESHPS